MNNRVLNHVKHSFKHNWDCLRHNSLGELAGSLGDLGTLNPHILSLYFFNIDFELRYFASNSCRNDSGGLYINNLNACIQRRLESIERNSFRHSCCGTETVYFRFVIIQTINFT